jgi:hypothetical protein
MMPRERGTKRAIAVFRFWEKVGKTGKIGPQEEAPLRFIPTSVVLGAVGILATRRLT